LCVTCGMCPAWPYLYQSLALSVCNKIIYWSCVLAFFRVHFPGMTTNELQLLPLSSRSSLFFLLLLLMCIIVMKLATSPPAACGPKRIQLSWNWDQGFLCLGAGRQGSTWATMFLVMSTCTIWVSMFVCVCVCVCVFTVSDNLLVKCIQKYPQAQDYSVHRKSESLIGVRPVTYPHWFFVLSTELQRNFWQGATLHCRWKVTLWRAEGEGKNSFLTGKCLYM